MRDGLLSLLSWLTPLVFLVAVTIVWFRKRARLRRLRARRARDDD